MLSVNAERRARISIYIRRRWICRSTTQFPRLVDVVMRLIDCPHRMSKIKKARSSEVQAVEAKEAAKEVGK